MIVYYDSHCKLCTRTAAVWKKLDWRHKLIFQSFREQNNYPPEMEKEIHIKKNGKWKKGYPAVIAISKTLPLFWPAVPFLYIGKWLGIGSIIYKTIAKNRSFFPVGQCEDGKCNLPPKK
ncbi:DUF393 domain-containing protein [Aciduricibacillus chroicocephali]|uniref:DUF393 domain-containing protein n=1 Tax=Aciduricibacillus chroicocephali TaxID=3054939 RepID=A0ABY9KXW5_9BACI|nr:DUF393 domain-containing protein [Bacillaceae bacterium 44XB]